MSKDWIDQEPTLKQRNYQGKQDALARKHRATGNPRGRPPRAVPVKRCLEVDTPTNIGRAFCVGIVCGAEITANHLTATATPDGQGTFRDGLKLAVEALGHVDDYPTGYAHGLILGDLIDESFLNTRFGCVGGYIKGFRAAIEDTHTTTEE